MYKLGHRLAGFSWQQWTVLAAFLLIAGFTGLHAFRAVREATYWSRHRDEPIRNWMSVGYVAHAYHVPAHILYEALGLPHTAHDRRPIREIAREQHRPVHEVIAVLQDAIVHARPPYPPPPPPDQGRSP